MSIFLLARQVRLCTILVSMMEQDQNPTLIRKFEYMNQKLVGENMVSIIYGICCGCDDCSSTMLLHMAVIDDLSESSSSLIFSIFS